MITGPTEGEAPPDVSRRLLNRTTPVDIKQLPQCSKCEKMVCTRTSPVPPRGKQPPSIVVVGQAPGEKENEEGKPFVGPAGQLLDELLEIIVGVDLSDVYYTNAVKCYPGKKGDNGGDRKPTMEEINKPDSHSS